MEDHAGVKRAGFMAARSRTVGGTEKTGLRHLNLKLGLDVIIYIDGIDMPLLSYNEDEKPWFAVSCLTTPGSLQDISEGI